jgi:hypothetical protein
MIDLKTLGAPPAGLVEKSSRAVENIIIALENGYLVYQMLDRKGHYVGFVDYRSVCIQ